MDKIAKKTAAHYGDGWTRGEQHITDGQPWHYDRMREVYDFPAGQHGVGLEAGCGGGRDTVRLALANPESTIYAVDISEGAAVTERLVQRLELENVEVLRADLAAIPLPSNSVDWCYSFGVLHHMSDPESGIREIGRLVKPDGRIVTYLYSDLREHPVLRAGVLVATAIRVATRRMPLPLLGWLCWVLAVPIYVLITLPCRLLGITELPYTAETTIRQVWGGLHDRLGAQVEKRYNPKSIAKLYAAGGFTLDGVGQIPGWRGWVSWGRRTTQHR